MTKGFEGDGSLINFYINSLVHLLADSPIDNKPLKVYLDFLKWFRKKGLLGGLGELSGLSDGVMRMHKSSGSSDLDQSVFDDAKNLPVFREIVAYSKKPDHILLRYLLSFLLLGKKLKVDNPKFSERAFRSWEEVEASLLNLQLSESDTNVLSHIVGWLVHPILFSYRRFRFGPGKVSERDIRDIYEKVRDAEPFIELSIKEIEQVTSEVKERTSRMKFVPKDALKGYRTIGMEPNILMYAQQGTLDALVRTFRSSNARHYFDLSDQNPNRECAIKGSYTGDYDTLDLSSASDSVHLGLVEKTFPEDLLNELMMSRSDKVLTPNGEIRPLVKFASMGSALCFPVQCIIFTAIGKFTELRLWHPAIFGDLAGSRYSRESDTEDILNSVFLTKNPSRPASPSNSSTGHLPLRVFGDDLCCDRRLTSGYIEDLTRFGFSVNVSKSFIDSTMLRESCGIFAFDGEDVTPLRLLVTNYDRNSHRSLESYLGFANSATKYHYTNLFRYVHWYIMYDSGTRKTKRSIPYVEDVNQSLSFHMTVVPRGGNNHLERRWNPTLQRGEFWVLAPRFKGLRKRSKIVKEGSRFVWKPAPKQPSFDLVDPYLYRQRLQRPPKIAVMRSWGGIPREEGLKQHWISA